MKRLLFATIMLLAFFACDKESDSNVFVTFEQQESAFVREEGGSITINSTLDCVPTGIHLVCSNGDYDMVKCYPGKENNWCFDESLLQESYEGYGCRLDIHNQRQYTITLDANVEYDRVEICFHEILNTEDKLLRGYPSWHTINIK